MEGNYLGFRGTEILDRGWSAHFRIEHPLDGDLRSAPGAACQSTPPFWADASHLGLAHVDWGRFTLGRAEQPALGVSAMGDPFTGGAAALDGLLYLRSRFDAAPDLDNRTPKAITWRSPEFLQRLTVELQSAPWADPGRRSRGFAIRYRDGVWDLGVGGQRWDRSEDSRAFPLAARYTFGPWVGTAGVTIGRFHSQDYRTIALGGSHQSQQGPRPPLTHVAVLWHRKDGEPGLARVALGRDWPLSRRTTLRATAAATTQSGRPLGIAAEFGITHAFSL